MTNKAFPLHPEEITQLRSGKNLVFTSLYINTPLEEAREIMGGLLIDLQTASDKLGFKISRSELEDYSLVPFSREELRAAARQDYYLLATPSLSLKQLAETNRHLFWPLGSVPNSDLRPGYLLIGMIPNSDHLNWNDQLAMLPKYSVVPRLAEMAYHYCLLLPESPEIPSARCSEPDSFGDHPKVGVGHQKIFVTFTWDRYPLYQVGIAASRYRQLSTVLTLTL